MKKLIPALFLLGLSACGNDSLPKYTKLDGLRILAINANPLEIQNPPAGVQNIQVTPYIVDIGGTGAVSLTVETCLDRGVSIGADPTCTSATDRATVNSTLNFTDAERTEPASPIAVNFTVPTNLLANYAKPLQFNGVPFLITVTATRGDTTVKSFRRVLVSTKTPNQAPGLADLLADGFALATLPTKEVNLSFTASTTPESYQYMNSKEEISNLTEVFETTWFASDGEIKIPRTRENETTTWTPPSTPPSGRKVVVVGVLRDGRGGIDVIIRKF